MIYQDGATIGERGTEGGAIVWDEEHPIGVRITLEQNCLRVPYAVTLIIHDWTYISRFTADGPSAQHIYVAMRDTLTAEVLPLLADLQADDPVQVEAAADAIAAFVEAWNG